MARETDDYSWQDGVDAFLVREFCEEMGLGVPETPEDWELFMDYVGDLVEFKYPDLSDADWMDQSGPSGEVDEGVVAMTLLVGSVFRRKINPADIPGALPRQATHLRQVQVVEGWDGERGEVVFERKVPSEGLGEGLRRVPLGRVDRFIDLSERELKGLRNVRKKGASVKVGGM